MFAVREKPNFAHWLKEVHHVVFKDVDRPDRF